MTRHKAAPACQKKDRQMATERAPMWSKPNKRPTLFASNGPIVEAEAAFYPQKKRCGITRERPIPSASGGFLFKYPMRRAHIANGLRSKAVFGEESFQMDRERPKSGNSCTCEQALTHV